MGTKDINTRDIFLSEDFGKWVTEACKVKYYDAEAMLTVTPIVKQLDSGQ